MATYTQLTRPEVKTLLKHFALEEYLDHRPIHSGIENSTYWLKTVDEQEWILTLFEQRSLKDVQFFIKLLSTLKQQGLPVAQLPNTQPITPGSVRDKPALILSKLPGQHPEAITERHGQQIGQLLAKLHMTPAQLGQLPDNSRGLEWTLQNARLLQSQVTQRDAKTAGLLDQSLAQLSQHASTIQSLPTGLIHGDCFPDNTLFVDQQLSGLIDFDNACKEVWLYDVAVCEQAWCYNQEAEHLPALSHELLTHYQRNRPFCAAEQQAWPMVQLWAALRFWVSRQQHWQQLPTAKQTEDYSKHPKHYQHIIEHLLSSIM